MDDDALVVPTKPEETLVDWVEEPKRDDVTFPVAAPKRPEVFSDALLPKDSVVWAEEEYGTLNMEDLGALAAVPKSPVELSVIFVPNKEGWVPKAEEETGFVPNRLVGPSVVFMLKAERVATGPVVCPPKRVDVLPAPIKFEEDTAGIAGIV